MLASKVCRCVVLPSVVSVYKLCIVASQTPKEEIQAITQTTRRAIVAMWALKIGLAKGVSLVWDRITFSGNQTAARTASNAKTGTG